MEPLFIQNCKLIEVVRALIDHGANVNAISRTDLTALKLALNGGHDETAQVLMAGGANVNALDEDS